MIEDILTKLIAAIEDQTKVTSENNDLLCKCIALSGGSLLADLPKTRGSRKATEQRTDEHGKIGHEPEPVAFVEETTVAVVEKPVVDETPAVVVEPDTSEQGDRIINEKEAGVIRATYRDGSKATSDVNAHKEGFTALRKEFGVENVTKLMLSQYDEFLTRLEAL